MNTRAHYLKKMKIQMKKVSYVYFIMINEEQNQL